jgi:hypothetical protein
MPMEFRSRRLPLVDLFSWVNKLPRVEMFVSYATFSFGANRILTRVADMELKKAMSDFRRFHIRNAAARVATMQVPGSETVVISWSRTFSSVSTLPELTVGEKGSP